MKPPPFDYSAPTSVEEVLDLLAEAGDDGKVLAGGQSLVPLLNFRVVRPSLLVDLNGVEGLSTLDWGPDGVRIGATVRQRAIELDSRLHEQVPLLVEAVAHVAHIPIRTRGTIGGSIAHADPAAEIPAVTLVLGATMHVVSGEGAMAVPASDFYLGPFTTSIPSTGFLVAVEFSPQPPGAGWAFVEIARIHGAFALVGVATLLHAEADGSIDDARLALCGIGGTPLEIEGLDDIMLGERPSAALFAHVARHVRDTIEPFSDTQSGAEYRRELAGVLTARGLTRAAERAGLEVAA